MEREINKSAIALIIAIIIIVGLLCWFVGKPKLEEYFLNTYGMQGYNYCLGSVLTQLEEKGYVQIQLPSNQSLILVPYKPEG